MRDDARKLGLSRPGYKYARLKGKAGVDGNKKENLYLKMDSALVHTPVKAPFKPKDVGVVVGKGKNPESLVAQFVSNLLEGPVPRMRNGVCET